VHVSFPLVQQLLPLLTALAREGGCAGDGLVASAVFRCLGKVLLHLTPLAAPSLQDLMSCVVGSFGAHRWPASLDAVATAVEAFGDDPGCEGPFRELLRHLATTTAQAWAVRRGSFLLPPPLFFLYFF